MTAVFNMDSRLSVQLNLAHIARNFKKARVKVHITAPSGPKTD